MGCQCTSWTSKVPLHCLAQEDCKDPTHKEKIRKKLSKVRERGHIGPERVVSLASFFNVEMGVAEDRTALDIRFVYDGTKSGLNDTTWAPSSWLPTPKN